LQKVYGFQSEVCNAVKETYYIYILWGISFFIFLNLTNITAKVYKLRLAEVNFLSCFMVFLCIIVSNLQKMLELWNLRGRPVPVSEV